MASFAFADACGRAIRPSTRLRQAIRAIQRVESRPAPTSTGPLRASGLGKLCPRATVLAARAPVHRVQDAASVWALGVGTAYHEAFQGLLLSLVGDGVLQGWWAREEDLPATHDWDGDPPWEAGVTVRRGAPQPTPALAYGWIPRPAGDGWAYRELSFYDHEDSLTGHCDGILVWPDGVVEVFELKTCSPASWHYVDASWGGQPWPEHVVQATLYAVWAGLDRARIVYVRKEADAIDGALAEHVVPVDPALVAELRTRVRETRAALGVWERWRAAGSMGDPPALPQRKGTCRHRGDRGARFCEYKEVCFE